MKPSVKNARNRGPAPRKAPPSKQRPGQPQGPEALRRRRRPWLFGPPASLPYVFSPPEAPAPMGSDAAAYADEPLEPNGVPSGADGDAEPTSGAVSNR